AHRTRHLLDGDARITRPLSEGCPHDLPAAEPDAGPLAEVGRQLAHRGLAHRTEDPHADCGFGPIRDEPLARLSREVLGPRREEVLDCVPRGADWRAVVLARPGALTLRVSHADGPAREVEVREAGESRLLRPQARRREQRDEEPGHGPPPAAESLCGRAESVELLVAEGLDAAADRLREPDVPHP